MRTVTLALALCACSLAGSPQPARSPNVVAGLEIDAPSSRTKPGVVRITAKVDAKETQKVKVLWDVAAQFEDAEETEAFEWEKRSERQIQVVVPASKGVIAVTAWAVVDGEPTSATPARTWVQVSFTQKKEQGAPPPPPDPREGQPQPQRQPKVKDRQPERQPEAEQVKAVYLVADLIDGDANLVALISSAGLKNRLRAAGYDRVVVGTEGDLVKKLNLQQFIADAGGAPCALVVSGDKVKRSSKLTPQTTAEDLLKLLE